MLEGRIIKNISNLYTVLCGDITYECIPRGIFRKEKITPLVGDYCVIHTENASIEKLLPRKNELQRPRVCNIDVALIVTSLKTPDFNSTLLDKEISSILLSHITPIICFTKLDLLKEEELSSFSFLKNYYEMIGVKVFVNQELESLVDYLKGKLVVLTGQSGAGKSTLLNNIDPSLNLKIDEISVALNRGKHTTRHTEIFNVQGISFCDTPGFSSLNLENNTKEEIKSSFLEFQNYSCRFQDCFHLKETNCGVKTALEDGEILESRYESYKRILEEAKK